MNKKRIIVWGAREFGKKYLNETISRTDTVIVAVTDNDSTLHNTKINDFIVTAPKSALANSYDVILICARESVQIMISNQLLAEGILKEKIVFYSNESCPVWKYADWNEIDDIFEQSKYVFSMLSDDESKKIFVNLLLYKFTGVRQYFEDIKYRPDELTDEFTVHKMYDNGLLKHIKARNGSNIIWLISNPNSYQNALEFSKHIGSYYNLCLLDFNSKESDYNEIQVFNTLPLHIVSANTLIVADDKLTSEVKSKLISDGVEINQIITWDLWNRFDNTNQYFDPDIISYCDNEVFLDVGSLDFTTSINFIQRAGMDNIKRIYVFEPNPKMQQRINENIEASGIERSKIVVQLLGLYNTNNTVSFDIQRPSYYINNNSDSDIPPTVSESIKVISLDELDIQEKITFIKLDIEGAELNALKGALNTIKKDKPKLAISVYHKPTDMILIPYFIKSISPEYKLYLRHYSSTPTETILYAVI